ncbi:hypothetical protein GDO81_005842 [Engystomops pustulosus]|uniref:S100P-binding protein n=1 Tax=Engystomops pustulosus TaxID=76066 RepID=A0AAV7CSA3_ENGPU|nr:hypothetical protein GDO81_005842 [Engystomops pustulosus]
MKVMNDPPVPGICSERQVVLYPIDWVDPLPRTMEDIKICIVNERATGCKRTRDEITPITPCSKRSRPAAFSCSTPSSSSASLWATRNSDFPAWNSPGQNDDQNEWDDSLLEPSDNEDGSPLYLTKDEIETLLDEDDDESCYAAEPLKKYNEMTTCVVTFTPSESENEAENGGASPCKTLDNIEAECEGDISNYAATPPSPCQSAIVPAQRTVENQSSVSNAKSPVEILTAKTEISSGQPIPLSEIKQESATLPPSPSTTNHVPHLAFSLSGIDAAVDWTEDPDLAFDCDIDNLLAISPGLTFSAEEDNDVELAAIPTRGNSPVVSNSTLPPRELQSDEVLTVDTTCSRSLAADQNFSPLLSTNTASLSNVHHLHPDGPKPIKEPLPTSSTIAPTEPSPNTTSPQTKKPSEAEESKEILNPKSTSSPADSAQSAAPRASDNQSKIVATLGSNAESSSSQTKEKPKIAVVAVHRPSFREVLSEFEMETNKDIYLDKVLMHIDGQRDGNLEDPHYELASLLNHISRENKNWQHPSDYTKRNHPRIGKKPTKRCPLGQWVTRNGGPNERFKNFPATFQRSPVPNVLPFSAS